MGNPPKTWKRRVARLLTEPTFHFFVVGALLFLAQRLIAGDQRVIVVSSGVKADVERRFRDRTDRPPTPSELESALGAWKRDEALYREALRDRLDRDDGTIRTVLADRVRARAALARPKRDPSEADLAGWLAAHRSLYETPRRYDYQSVVFPKAQPTAAEQLEKYQQAVKKGANPTALGRPIVGGDLTAGELKERFGSDLATRLQGLPIGQWQRIDTGDALVLVRVTAVEGGLPGADELHQRLVADWSLAQQQRAVDEAVQAIVNRYRFEERP
jgi:hypothetical protein